MSKALPRAFGPAVLAAAIRTTPGDFLVEELPSFDATGEGEHLLLTVEKRGLDTGAAARQLARWAGVADMAVGYAGMKDRHAVTRQRFSVHLPRRQAPAPESLQGESLRVLDAAWHHRKLPRGALAGNRFDLVLRQVEGERAAIEARLATLLGHGLPNWVGEQRFGRDGGNVDAALTMFEGRRVPRDQRSILLSAARSQLFNLVLAARVGDGSWNRGLEGEVWALAGSRSVFGPEPWSDALADRLTRFDIHPSGPLWGSGPLRSAGPCAAIELSTLDDERSLRLRAGLEGAGLAQERRALRLPVPDLYWEWLEDRVLRLRFALPPGSYATAVLHELGDLGDAAAVRRNASDPAANR
jgi:tRNA pseudouridine13 synthase